MRRAGAALTPRRRERRRRRRPHPHPAPASLPSPPGPGSTPAPERAGWGRKPGSRGRAAVGDPRALQGEGPGRAPWGPDSGSQPGAGVRGLPRPPGGRAYLGCKRTCPRPAGWRLSRPWPRAAAAELGNCPARAQGTGCSGPRPLLAPGVEPTANPTLKSRANFLREARGKRRRLLGRLLQVRAF